MTNLPRCFREWSNTQIIEELAKEKRQQDIELWHKFINAGPHAFDAMQGGNVQLLDEPLTEYTRICKLLREFGRMAPDVFYLTRAQFEDVCCWEKETEQK